VQTDASKSRAGQTDGRLDVDAAAKIRGLCKILVRRDLNVDTGHSYLPVDQQPAWVMPLVQTCLQSATATRFYAVEFLMKKVQGCVSFICS
jgi:hypothetical protein